MSFLVVWLRFIKIFSQLTPPNRESRVRNGSLGANFQKHSACTKGSQQRATQIRLRFLLVLLVVLVYHTRYRRVENSKISGGWIYSTSHQTPFFDTSSDNQDYVQQALTIEAAIPHTIIIYLFWILKYQNTYNTIQMNFSWQQRVLLLVSAVLSATPSPAVAASFVIPATTTTTKAAAFTNKNGRYNPLVHVSAGGDDAAGNQDAGASVPDTPPAPEPPAPPAAKTIPEATTTSLLGPNAKSPPGLLRSNLPGMPWHKLPDYVTYVRCIAIPVFVAFFYANMKGKNHLYTGTIFALASITDWLDGFLARRWDISTACK